MPITIVLQQFDHLISARLFQWMTAPCLLAESPVHNWNPIAVGGICSEIMHLLGKFSELTDAAFFQWHGQKCDKVDIRRTFNIIPCNLLLSACLKQYPIPNTYSTRTPNRNTSGFPTGPLVDRCCSRWLGCWEVSTNPSAQYPKLLPPSLEGLVAHYPMEERFNKWMGRKMLQSQNQLEIAEIYQFEMVFTNWK